MQMNSRHVEYSGIAAGSVANSRPAVWAGRVLSGMAAAALLADSAGKLLQVQPVIDATMALGYPRTIVFTLGVMLFSAVIAYVAPRTSVLGALLLTAYLGGAVASQVRVEAPLFTHVLVPVWIAVFAWVGLVLRDERLRAFLPFRSAQ